MTAYGNGECVNFIRMKVCGVLLVYQWFFLGWERVSLGVR